MTHQQTKDAVLKYMKCLVGKETDLVKKLFDYPLVRCAGKQNFSC